MSRDDSRLASVLAELADLGRRISDRATELARLSADRGERLPPELAERVADVRTSAADLTVAAAAAAPATTTADHAPRTTAGIRRRRVRASPAVEVADDKAAARRTTRRQPQSATGGSATRRVVAHDPGPRVRPLMPALVSVAVNVAAILVLAVIFVAAEAKPKRPVLTLGASEETFVDELTPVELVATDEAAAELDQAPNQFPELDTLTTDAVALDDVSLDAAALAADAPAAIPAAFDAVDMLADVGGGTAAESAGSARGGGPAGGGPPGAASFFGRAGQGQTVCFICDNSNSYRDGGFHVVLDEVARAVDSLRPDQSFFVVFFSDAAYPMFHPEPVDVLQPASPDNKRRLRAWLATVEMCGGGQGIDEAVKLAGKLDADVVYFLSDGEHAASVVDRVVTADFGGAVVHTFGMQQGVLDRRTGRIDPDRLHRQQDFDRNLVAIATAHGGGFTPVTVPPQAAMLERLRPIPKNRAPGPVWGLKL